MSYLDFAELNSDDLKDNKPISSKPHKKRIVIYFISIIESSEFQQL